MEAQCKLLEAEPLQGVARSALVQEAALLFEHISDFPTAAETYYSAGLFVDAARIYSDLPGRELEVVQCYRQAKMHVQLHNAVDEYRSQIGERKADGLYHELALAFYTKLPERALICLDNISLNASPLVLEFLEKTVINASPPVPQHTYPTHDLALTALLAQYVKRRDIRRTPRACNH